MIYILLIIAAVLISAYIVHDANPAIFAPAVHCIKRKWLQHNIEGWQRDLEHIHATRRNDEQAERVIVREIISAMSELADLKSK